MMISPEGFYELELKGKSVKEIRRVIRDLKRTIKENKDILENSDVIPEKVMVHPGPSVMISLSRDYLEIAIKALMENGEEYKPTKSELRDMEFNNNIEYIDKISYTYGNFFFPETVSAELVDDKFVLNYRKHIRDEDRCIEEVYDSIDRTDFMEGLKKLHLGEWKKRYTSEIQYIDDMIDWTLEISYSNGLKNEVFKGDGHMEPYNFDELMELFRL
ncbi:MAG: hypothetical protein Q4D13_06795 [Erysipelotrichaceae bacterium]|nr:hypothetical protein [Erysipelotrichaceae bacterium]